MRKLNRVIPGSYRPSKLPRSHRSLQESRMLALIATSLSYLLAAVSCLVFLGGVIGALAAVWLLLTASMLLGFWFSGMLDIGVVEEQVGGEERTLQPLIRTSRHDL